MKHAAHEHPALGLALALLGIIALPAPLVMLSQLAFLGSWSLETDGVVLLQTVAIALQIATGCAIAWRSPRAGPCTAAYAVASLALTIVLARTLAEDAGVLGLVALAVETLGVPLIVLVAPLFARPGASSRRGEASAMLLVLGVAALVILLLHTANDVRMAISGGLMIPVGAALGLLWRTSVSVAIAILAVRAGVMLRGAPVARAARALRVYVIVALCGQLALTGFRIVGTLASDFHPEPARLIAFELAGAIGSIGKPLLIWAYVRRDLVTDQAGDHPVPAAPAWAALLFVPFLLARPLFVNATIAPTLGVVLAVVIGGLFAAQGIATWLAASAALRARTSTIRLAFTATLLALASTATIIIASSYERELPRPQLAPGSLVMMVVTCAVLAWLHRAAPSPLPRAVAAHKPPSRQAR